MTVLNFAHRDQIAAADRSVAETALPAHLMVIMHDEVVKANFEFRSDIVDKLNDAVKAALIVLPDHRVIETAKKVDAVAKTLLRDVNAGEEPLLGFFTCAQFVLQLVEEGYLADVGNMAVLVAMLVNTEIEEYETAGSYKHDRVKVKSIAQKMIVRAQFQGFYMKRLDQRRIIA